MSNTEGHTLHGDPIEKRGIYLLADSPLQATPLALEDGSGDKQLLAEAVAGELDQEEFDAFISELIHIRGRDYAIAPDAKGTSIVCEDCGHIRPTTERNPTLANCQKCGSHNLRYREESEA